jgi:hypothetical protein
MIYRDQTPRKSQKSDPVGEVGLISMYSKMLRRVWVITGSKDVLAFPPTLSPVAYVKQVLAPALRAHLV